MVQAAAHHTAQEYAVYWTMVRGRGGGGGYSVLALSSRQSMPGIYFPASSSPQHNWKSRDHVLARYLVFRGKKPKLINDTIPHIKEQQHQNCHTPTQIQRVYLKDKLEKPCQGPLPTGGEIIATPKQQPVLAMPN